MNLIPKAMAQTFTPITNVESELEGGFFTDFGQLISSVLNIVLILATILVLFYLIMGGISWLTSGGDKGKTESARNQITAAVIGLIIIVSAWAIMLFVQSLLGIQVFGD